ncbi:hypothetical protein B0T19DRAFT_260173 [Cercophora scortea]|uniref:F-box domain-containing protein n=1 Tax=Cercophora scortea TaxID=314031 RepID=A0AAE0M6J0_9PEZI|nr:hypothetical protein B0T19DRAFT_260173 [Cercophora scortea]
MENRLASQLEALGSDPQLRKTNLHHLVSSMTHFEVRDLREHLAKVDLRTDIVARLPVELRVLVASHVDGADIISVLNVSRKWRDMWLQDDVVKLLADRWFPGFSQYHLLKGQITSVKPDLHKLFYSAAQRHRARSLGRFRSVFYHGPFTNINDYRDRYFTLDPDCHPAGRDVRSRWDGFPPTMPGPDRFPQVSPPDRLHYSHGRLAWVPEFPEPDNDLVIVDDLRTRLRRLYFVPYMAFHGSSAVVQALGDKLLVVSVHRNLHAWNLETNQRCSVVVPYNIRKCRTVGNHVYIIGRSFLEISVWKFAESLRELKTAEAREHATQVHRKSHGDPQGLDKQTIDLLFHPLLDTTVFISVFLQRSKTVAVYEYIEGQLFRVHERFLPDLQLSCNVGDVCVAVSLRCAQINAYGRYAVVEIHHQGPICPREQHLRKGVLRPSVTLLCFDVLSTSFFTQTFPVLGIIFGFRNAGPSYWNGQCTGVSPVVVPRDTSFTTFRDSLVATVDETSLVGDSVALDARFYGAVEVSAGTNKVLRRRTMPWPSTIKPTIDDFLDAAERGGVRGVKNMRKRMMDMDVLFGDQHPYRYCLDLGESRAPVDGFSYEQSRNREDIMRLDDDFIILAGRHGYVVWSFWTDMKNSYTRQETGSPMEDPEMRQFGT